MSKKKWIAICLLAVLLVTLLPVPGHAAQTQNGVTWKINGMTLTVSGEGWITSTLAAGWSKYHEGIEKVVIQPGIEGMCDSVFEGCTSLKSVSLPDSMTAIPHDAFRNCISLTEVDLPENLQAIGSNAFAGCRKLQQIQLPNSLESLGTGVFRGSGLTSVTLPDNITTIGEWLFAGCTKLQEVTFSPYTTEIGYNAFDGCTKLSEVTLPDTLRRIRSDAFQNCTSLEAVHFSDLSKWLQMSFGSNHFPSHTKLYINGQQLTHLVIPEDIQQVPGFAFEGCAGLVSVTIPSHVTLVRLFAFANCKDLTYVYITNSLTALSGFEQIPNLQQVEFDGSLNDLRKYTVTDTTILEAEWTFTPNGWKKTGQEALIYAIEWYQVNHWKMALLVLVLLLIPVTVAIWMVEDDYKMRKKMAEAQQNIAQWEKNPE